MVCPGKVGNGVKSCIYIGGRLQKVTLHQRPASLRKPS